MTFARICDRPPLSLTNDGNTLLDQSATVERGTVSNRELAAQYDEWDGIVFDFDGTLVKLIVDWPAVETELASTLADAGMKTAGATCWELLSEARDQGRQELAESVLAPREITGARVSERLPLAADVPSMSGPVAVCSLNCEAACRTGLEVHELTDEVDAVVGRDTLDVWKPDPAPLLESIDRLGIEPANALFIGDSPRDRRTAERANVDFRWVRDAIGSDH